MKRIITLITIFTINIQLNAQTPTIKWWYDTNDSSFGQSAAADLDGDGLLEMVFGCYRNDGFIYTLNGDDGSLLWKFDAHDPVYGDGCNDVAPLIYDIDGDGSPEVIVPGSCYNRTFCFDGATGVLKWQCVTNGSDSPPVIADIDNDGKLEILHGEFGGSVICINAETGVMKWRISVDPNSWVQTAPTIVDLDGDGQLDFVVATWNFDNYDGIYAYRGDNHQLMWSLPVSGHFYHGTTVADLDGDGKPELLLGSYNDTVYCLNGEDGSINWTYQANGGYVGSPVVVADIDNDGSCEVIFTSWYKVYVLSNNGTLKWVYNTPNYGQAFRGVAVADVSNDSYLDLVFGTDDGKVYALSGNNGNLLWTVDLAAHYGADFDIDHAPLIADFDGDGLLDVFIVGGHTSYPDIENNYGRAYMISIGAGNGPEWLMFQHDILRRSTLCENEMSIDEIENLGDFSVYPVPFSVQTTIQTKKDLTNAELIITNSNGQTVREINKISGNKFALNREDMPAGVYFLKLIQDKKLIGIKKILITN